MFAFTRPGDERTQEFATSLGAIWAGGSDETPPEQLDAAIIFASAGELVPQALKLLAPGGTVVCAGIHMSDIPSFPYDDLWHERTIRSVANLTRQDGDEFLALAPRGPGPDDDHHVPARAGRAGARRPARRPLRGHRRDRPVALASPSEPAPATLQTCP